MYKGTLAVLAAAAFLVTGATPALAAKWTGKATNLAGDFNYGKVTFTTSGSTMKNLVIEGVTTSGCGGYKSVIVPKLKIRGGKFSASYVPVPGLNDVIRVRGTIRGSRASGQFSEGPLDISKPPLCQNKGKFTASKG
jgi:hypothetical protein